MAIAHRQLLRTTVLSGAISVGMAITLISLGQYYRLSAGAWVIHTWEVLATLQKLEAEFVRLQFNKSSDKVVAFREIEQSLNDLHKLTQDNASQQRRIQRLKILVQAEVFKVDQKEVVRDKEIQQLISNAIQEEFALLRTRETERENAWVILVGCQILSLVLVVGSVVWIVRLYDRNYQLIQRQTEAIGSLAHDIRSPISSLHLSIEMLIGKYPEQNRRLLRMQKTCLFAIALIEDVRFFTDPKLECERTLLDINTFCADLAETINAVVSDHPRITFIAPHSLTANLDADLVRRILTNLLNNACNYSPPNCPVELIAFKRGDDVIFHVLDRGEGVPVQDRENLFDSFRRGSNTGEVKGTGLGLAIVKRCVQICGGNIWFEDRQGGGTIFVVVLPGA